MFGHDTFGELQINNPVHATDNIQYLLKTPVLYFQGVHLGGHQWHEMG